MRAFFDRYLPGGERTTVLWLAFGGAGVTAASSMLGSEVVTRLRVYAVDGALSPGATHVIRALAELSLVTLAIALLIAIARAPKAIALYLLLGGMLGAVMALINLPGDLASLALQQTSAGTLGSADNPVVSALASAMVSLGVGLGAVAGAWVASTVSLDRIRDAGFTGDDPDGTGLRRRPGSRGWAFLGWEGRPVEGDAWIAVALVAVAVIPSIVSAAVTLMLPFAMGASLMDGGTIGIVVWTVMLAIAWFLSAGFVTLKTGVSSAWLVALAGLVTSAAAALRNVVQLGGAESVLQSLAAAVIPTIVFAGAALLGTRLALRREPATLTSPGGRNRRGGK